MIKMYIFMLCIILKIKRNQRDRRKLYLPFFFFNSECVSTKVHIRFGTNEDVIFKNIFKDKRQLFLVAW